LADTSRPAVFWAMPKNTATLLLSARHCKKIKDKLHDLIILPDADQKFSIIAAVWIANSIR